MKDKTYTPEGSNGQGDDALSAAAATVERDPVPGELRNFVADIGDLIKATTSLTGEDLARARTRLVERAAAAKASLEKMGGAVTARARHSAEVTNAYVHEQPWQAIGIGAAVGLLVGIVLARRRA
jgi:ElaB/YqjD/DUF883 family membrane-anchored ribosome-binding protein